MLTFSHQTHPTSYHENFKNYPQLSFLPVHTEEDLAEDFFSDLYQQAFNQMLEGKIDSHQGYDH